MINRDTAPAPVFETLPNEIPRGTDYSTLPREILHSSTVETLIGQNEDLMARLNVNLRRLSGLESQLAASEKTCNDLRRINASLTTQSQIICEKEEMLKDRAEAAEREKNHTVEHLRRLESFHRRILKWVKPQFKQKGRADLLLHITEANLRKQQSLAEELQVRVLEADDNYNKNQFMLVESYEAQMNELKTELERTQSERIYFKERSERLEESRLQLSQAENEVVRKNRQIKELERKLSEEVQSLQKDMGNFRREAKQLAAQLSMRDAERERLLAQKEEHLRKLSENQNQMESLEAIYADTLKSKEEFEKRVTTLTQINYELAIKIKNQAQGALDPLKRVDQILRELETGLGRLDFIDREANSVEGKIDKQSDSPTESGRKQEEQEFSIS